jgi:tetratricopeptide (TPR) repeat protein
MWGADMTIIFILILVIVAIFAIFKRGTIVVGLAANAYSKGEKEKAERLYRLADKMGGMGFDATLNCGYFFLRNGNVAEARTIFNRTSMSGKLNKLQKQRLKSISSLVAWKDGQIDDAIEMLEDLIDEGYVTSVLYGNLGLFYIIKKDKEKALEVCLEAYEYNSDDDVILDNLAEAYTLCGDKEKAKEIYEKLLEREPDFPDAYYGYGILLMESGKQEEGLSYLAEALEKRFSFLSPLSRERVEDIYYTHKKILEEDKN